MKIVRNKYSKQKPKSKKVLLNPSEKAKLYVESLKADKKAYYDANTGELKFGSRPLDERTRAHYRGYIHARNDNGKAWKANKKKNELAK